MKNEMKSLPSMEHKFSIQVVGENTKMNWVGPFTYHRPTIGKTTEIEVTRARMSGDLATVHQDVGDQLYVLAFLRSTLIDFPEWWRESDFGASLYDPNVIFEVFNECLEFEASWREKVHGTSDQNKSEPSGVESSDKSNEEIDSED